jgi:hypothetical protein
MNRPAEVLGVYENEKLRAYVILQGQRPQDEDKRSQILEFAGDRRSVVGALGHLVQSRDLDALNVHVMGYDGLLCDLLSERGLEGEPAHTSGTVTLVNFPQFMERMRPHFAEILGLDEAEGLVFRKKGDQLIFGYGGDQVVAPDQGAAVELIFGTLDRREEELLAAGGRAGEALRAIFPIPGLWYGPNYV